MRNLFIVKSLAFKIKPRQNLTCKGGKSKNMLKRKSQNGIHQAQISKLSSTYLPHDFLHQGLLVASPALGNRILKK